MKHQYWMKLWIEMLDDEKVATLPHRLWRRWVEMLLLAKAHGDDGTLPDLRTMAWRLRETAEVLESDLVELAKTGLVASVDGLWIVPKFSKRQAPKDGAERQRISRQWRPCHSAVTPESQTEAPEDRGQIQMTEEQNKSALASFFEPKPEPEPPAERTPTNWPQAAERLRPFLDAYEEWTGFHPPKGGVRSLWLSGAKEWVDTFGESSLRLFEDAMRYCDKNGLRPKSPKGLLFYGEDNKRKPADPDSDKARRRYVEGEFADVIEH